MHCIVFVFGVGMDAEIDAQCNKQPCADISEPFLEHAQLMRQAADTHCTVTDRPRYQHNRKPRTQSENHQHQPRHTHRHGYRQINHRNEIDQPVRAERHGKEHSQQERPQPTRFAVGVLQPFAQSVVMRMVVSAQEQYHAAQQHKHRQYGFAVLLYYPPDTVGLCAQKKRNTQYCIGAQFARYKHHTVDKHLVFVANLLVDIPDSGNARKQGTRIQYGQ